MRQALVVLGALFAVTLAVVVGQRLSTEAMAVVVGVVCGVAASVPVSLGLLLLLGRLPGLRPSGGAQPEGPDQLVHRRDTLPVVVVTPGPALPGWSGAAYAGSPFWPAAGAPLRERSFRIIGEDMEVTNGASVE